MRIVLIHLCVFGFLFNCRGQSSAVLNWSAYGEMYAGWDDLRAKNHQRPDFLYNHTRSEELALNLALIQASYSDTSWRVKAGLMAGTYSLRNLASEPAGLRSIFEATIGVRLSAKRNIWLEAGVFPSHLGYESAIGMDCPTLTRSLIAENSPYYESGIKILAESPSKKWRYMLAVLNGWQRMAIPDGYYTPALGGQLTHQVNAHWSINYSNFFGDQSADDDVALRQFHNLYAVYRSTKGVLLALCADWGMQPDLNDEERTLSSWYGGAIMSQVPLGNRWKLNGRLEQYVDDRELVAVNPFADGFHLKGYSLGMDYAIGEMLCLRAEVKRFDGPRFHFIQNETTLTNAAHMVNLSLCWRKL